MDVASAGVGPSGKRFPIAVGEFGSFFSSVRPLPIAHQTAAYLSATSAKRLGNATGPVGIQSHDICKLYLETFKICLTGTCVLLSQKDDMATLLDLTAYLNAEGAAADGAHTPIDNWWEILLPCLRLSWHWSCVSCLQHFDKNVTAAICWRATGRRSRFAMLPASIRSSGSPVQVGCRRESTIWQHQQQLLLLSLRRCWCRRRGVSQQPSNKALSCQGEELHRSLVFCARHREAGHRSPAVKSCSWSRAVC